MDNERQDEIPCSEAVETFWVYEYTVSFLVELILLYVVCFIISSNATCICGEVPGSNVVSATCNIQS